MSTSISETEKAIAQDIKKMAELDVKLPGTAFQPPKLFWVGPEGNMTRGSAFAAGLDLAVKGEHFIRADGTTFKLPTGVFCAIPEGYVGIIKERSGLGLKGLAVRAGVIDSDYRGEINVLVQLSNETGERLHLKPGKHVAQLVIVPVPALTVERVESIEALGTTDRGEKGFGSSDPGK